ncbi:MAG: hypothetical protein WBA81_16210, partial [Rhodococcus sp. (in: high G+C Gram-positive bacteria)]
PPSIELPYWLRAIATWRLSIEASRDSAAPFASTIRHRRGSSEGMEPRALSVRLIKKVAVLSMGWKIGVR